MSRQPGHLFHRSWTNFQRRTRRLKDKNGADVCSFGEILFGQPDHRENIMVIGVKGAWAFEISKRVLTLLGQPKRKSVANSIRSWKGCTSATLTIDEIIPDDLSDFSFNLSGQVEWRLTLNTGEEYLLDDTSDTTNSFLKPFDDRNLNTVYFLPRTPFKNFVKSRTKCEGILAVLSAWEDIAFFGGSGIYPTPPRRNVPSVSPPIFPTISSRKSVIGELDPGSTYQKERIRERIAELKRDFEQKERYSWEKALRVVIKTKNEQGESLRDSAFETPLKEAKKTIAKKMWREEVTLQDTCLRNLMMNTSKCKYSFGNLVFAWATETVWKYKGGGVLFSKGKYNYRNQNDLEYDSPFGIVDMDKIFDNFVINYKKMQENIEEIRLQDIENWKELREKNARRFEEMENDPSFLFREEHEKNKFEGCRIIGENTPVQKVTFSEDGKKIRFPISRIFVLANGGGTVTRFIRDYMHRLSEYLDICAPPHHRINFVLKEKGVVVRVSVDKADWSIVSIMFINYITSPHSVENAKILCMFSDEDYNVGKYPALQQELDKIGALWLKYNDIFQQFAGSVVDGGMFFKIIGHRCAFYDKQTPKFYFAVEGNTTKDSSGFCDTSNVKHNVFGNNYENVHDVMHGMEYRTLTLFSTGLTVRSGDTTDDRINRFADTIEKKLKFKKIQQMKKVVLGKSKGSMTSCEYAEYLEEKMPKVYAYEMKKAYSMSEFYDEAGFREYEKKLWQKNLSLLAFLRMGAIYKIRFEQRVWSEMDVLRKEVRQVNASAGIKGTYSYVDGNFSVRVDEELVKEYGIGLAEFCMQEIEGEHQKVKRMKKNSMFKSGAFSYNKKIVVEEEDEENYQYHVLVKTDIDMIFGNLLLEMELKERQVTGEVFTSGMSRKARNSEQLRERFITNNVKRRKISSLRYLKRQTKRNNQPLTEWDVLQKRKRRKHGGKIL